MKAIAVCLVTYNHERYISQAIESVLSQKTSVPYKIFIGEDCSTDRTLDICWDYKNRYSNQIELLVSQENKGLVQNTLDLMKIIIEQGYSYIAMLDGDDYWIDNGKLQKQFDFLESYMAYGLIHTNNEILLENSRVERVIKVNPLHGYVFDRIEHFGIANCTVMFRTKLLKYIDFNEFVQQGFRSVDYVMYAIFSKYVQFAFIDDYTAVWRRGHDSVSNTNNKEQDIAYIENDINMWRYLGSVFPERFLFSEQSADKWRNFRKFNIAFRYRDFELANQIIRYQQMIERDNLIFKIKKAVARNRLLFNLWYFVKTRQ